MRAQADVSRTGRRSPELVSSWARQSPDWHSLSSTAILPIGVEEGANQEIGEPREKNRFMPSRRGADDEQKLQNDKTSDHAAGRFPGREHHVGGGQARQEEEKNERDQPT